MSMKNEDYRTNRADYAIAAKHGREAAKGNRDKLVARKKKLLVARDRRLLANPSESAPEPKARTVSAAGVGRRYADWTHYYERSTANVGASPP